MFHAGLQRGAGVLADSQLLDLCKSPAGGDGVPWGAIVGGLSMAKISEHDLPAPPADGFVWVAWEGEPHAYKLWADGALRNRKGHWLLQHPGALSAVRAAALQRGVSVVDDAGQRNMGAILGDLKVHKATALKRESEAEALNGMVRAAKDHKRSVKLPAEAWGVVAEQQTRLALGAGRESTGAARFVGEITGLHRGQGGSVGAAVQVNVVIGGELASKYGDSVDIIEGEIVSDSGESLT